ncbi:MAG TPA: amino acid--tRNA ligase-related protein, partial [Myxococcota bacterium]|nr:amino acid--tRNA ligase-related protein [Myxococcota bacterium]
MTTNPLLSPSREILWFRHHIKRAIRSMLDGQGFIEIDTPYLLNANTPDPFIDPVFATLTNTNNAERQLHTSPEIWLKRCIPLGFDKIYHLARVFRDDPPSTCHSTEFTMLEWYRVHAKLDDLLEDCEEIFARCCAIAHENRMSRVESRYSIERIDLDFLWKELV